MTKTTINPNRFFIQPSNEQFETIPHFVPPRTRDSAEAWRRKKNPAGALILEQQLEGISIVGRGLNLATNLEEAAEWAELGAVCLVGSGKYHLNGTDQMRYASVPILGAVEPRTRPDSEQLYKTAISKLAVTQAYASHLLASHRFNHHSREYKRVALPTERHLVNSAFLLATIGSADITSDPGNYLSNTEAQKIAVDQCKETVRRAGEVSVEINTHLSVAQLASPYSPARIAIEQTGSDTVVGIVQRAA